MSTTTVADTPPRDIFGHPRGLSTLFFTEMWERFSYYGMKAILLYYMYFEVTRGGLGIDPVLAKSLVSVYGASLYMAGIAGGWVADRLLGSRRSVSIGCVLIMFAHICLATPGGGAPALYASMVLLVSGTALLKPNITKNVGDLYAAGDKRRDAGFTLFVMGVQVGAFVAPIVVEALTDVDRHNPDGNHFHWGFGAAAIGMAIGLVQYLLRAKGTMGAAGTQVPNPLEPEHRSRVFGTIASGLVAIALVIGALVATGNFSADLVVNAVSVLSFAVPVIYFVVMLRSSHVTQQERGRVLAYIPLFAAMVIFWFVEEQASSVIAEFAEKQTDLSSWGFHISPTWFQSINPVVMLIFAPFVAIMWTKMRNQPNTPQKFSIGLVLTGAGFAVMFVPWVIYGPTALADPIWPLLSIAVVAVGELFVNPVSLSATTQLAPAAFAAQVVGLNYAADAAGQGLIAQVSKFYSAETFGPYFAISGVVTLLVGVALWFYAPKVHQKMIGE